MKIAFFVYQFPKSTETFILNRITRLIDSGVEVVIYALRNPLINKSIEDRTPEDFVQPDVERYKLMDRVTYFPRKDNNSLDREEISRKISEDGVSLVHFQWSTLANEVLEGGRLPCPSVVTFHETHVPSTWRAIVNYPEFFERVDYVLAESDFIRRFLIKQGCSEDKIETHHTGVDMAKFVPGKLTAGEHEVIRLSQVSSMVQKKGYEYSIRAVNELKKSGIKVKFQIVGDGLLYEELVKIVSDLNLEEEVIFRGKGDSNLVLEVFSQTDVFLHPSIVGDDGSEEGIPTAIIEAIASGLPVVATTHTGIPEAVWSGMNGFLLPEKDATGIAGCVQKIANDQLLKADMGRMSRKIAEEYFNLRTQHERSIVVYEQIIKRYA